MSLYRRKDSPYFWSKLYHEGNVVSFSTGERHKVPALRVERERASELQQQTRVVGKHTLGTLAAKFIIWKEADGRAEGTINKSQEYLKREILPFFGAERDVRTVKQSDLEDYKAKRMGEVSASMVCKELSTLRQLLLYAVEVHHLMPVAPVIKNPKLNLAPKWKLLTPDEVDRLIGELGKFGKRGKEALPYFLLMANTGMRGGETSKMTWEMLNSEKSAINLPATITKNRTARTVPLNKVAKSAIKMMQTMRGNSVGRVFSCKAHYGTWRKACENAGLGSKKGERPRPHDLRHTFGSLLHAAGRTTPEVRDILGHLSLYMANLYAHTYPKHLYEAVDSVQLGGGSKRSQKRSYGKALPREKRSCFGQFGFDEFRLKLAE